MHVQLLINKLSLKSVKYYLLFIPCYMLNIVFELSNPPLNLAYSIQSFFFLWPGLILNTSHVSHYANLQNGENITSNVSDRRLKFRIYDKFKI